MKNLDRGIYMIGTNEITYLEKTLNQLTIANKKLSTDINHQEKYMVEYKSELDKFEVYNYQQPLRMIDKRGFAHVTEREHIRKLNTSILLHQFYSIYTIELWTRYFKWPFK
ncbi:hypothetical protein [Lysinibacillus sphaericus]|uniref:hypothetical protein n=2 Tax=Bacillaceae TaxID=186817 RepID=UPI003D7FF3C4